MAHAAGCSWELGEKAGLTVGSVQGGSGERLGAVAVLRAGMHLSTVARVLRA